jgi:hypothetical protein
LGLRLVLVLGLGALTHYPRVAVKTFRRGLEPFWIYSCDIRVRVRVWNLFGVMAVIKLVRLVTVTVTVRVRVESGLGLGLG